MRSLMDRKTEDSEEDQKTYDEDLTSRPAEDILREYDSNPFFRAKLNYLLKTANSPSQLAARR